MDSQQIRYMHLYLTDHWAAAGGGVSLVGRMARENRSTPWAVPLQDLADDVRSDDAVLANLRTAMGISRGRVRRRLLTLAEHVSRLKLNGNLLRYSPLSRVEEAEAMIGAVAAKQRLWASLIDRDGIDMTGIDFRQLVACADAQLATLHDFHRWAADEAFGAAAHLPSGLIPHLHG